MILSALFARRVRGVRLVNLWGAGVLLVLVVGLYLTKTFASDERADIARTEAQIRDEQRRIRLLEAEVAYLEQPQRIEALATRYLGLEPTPGKHEIALRDLSRIALAAASPQPSRPAEPSLAPAPAAPAAAPQEAPR
jgi:cell division protein FtsL